MRTAPREHAQRLLASSLVFIALVVAAIGSLGGPLITSVAGTFPVSLASAQWTLTITLLSGAVATPVLGRLGAGGRRREAIIATLAIVTAGGILTVAPLPFAGLIIGRAAQGVGLGLTALMMGVARDHLEKDHSASVIALISVASTIGIGVGYPLAGLLTAMSVNQVVRSVGFSIGSAVGGLILSSFTVANHPFPTYHAYSVAAWIGAAVMAACAAICVMSRGRPAKDH